MPTYGKDRVFVIFQNKEETKTPQMEFLINAGHPVITIRFKDDYDLGCANVYLGNGHRHSRALYGDKSISTSRMLRRQKNIHSL